MDVNFKGKNVAILGLGIEGLSTARFLTGNGAKVSVLDRKKEEEIDQAFLEEVKKLSNYSSSEVQAKSRSNNENSSRQARTINFRLGKDYLKNLQDFDILVRSPGVKRNLPEILDAEESGVIITSQTQIFFDLCPAKIIGVTGTKGKGTTCSLIYEMLKSQGKDVYLGGNIGNPPIDFLDKLNDQSWVVLELSSFQLQDLNKSPHFAKASWGRPHIAVVIMITSEHLDYHKDTKEYVEAKRNIFRFQTASDFAVVNRDYPASNESDIHTEVKIFKISRERDVDEGCFVKDEKIILNYSSAGRLSHVVNDARQSLDGSLNLSSSSLSERRSPKDDQNTDSKTGSTLSSFASEKSSSASDIVINTSEILLPGKHNWENVCAAVMAATLAGVSKQNIVSVLKTFKGLEHRLELVEEIDGVKYYDDSFSTTPETAIAAIEAFKNSEILILGGSSKNSDFTELGQVISDSKNIKAIIGIGEEWERIKESIDDYSSSERSESRSSKDSSRQARTIKYIEGCKNMREVVVSAALEAEPGDVVILSPACASFGIFKDYKDRGEQFKKEVEALKVRAFK